MDEFNRQTSYQEMYSEQGPVCSHCGTPLIGGVCPRCGKQARKPNTAAKALLAIFLVLLVGGVVGFVSLYAVGEITINIWSTESPSNMPEPFEDAADTGETDPGFYWPDWEMYLYSYDNRPAESFDTIYDARESGLSYEIKDFEFNYSGNQEFVEGTRGIFGIPSDDGISVSYDAHYVQLEGDSPAIEEINETIRYWALDGVYYLIQPDEELREYMLDNEYGTFYSTTDTYVSYMSENFLSITVLESDVIVGQQFNYAYTLNFDMQTGEMLELYDILTPDDEFMQTFDALGNEQYPELQGFQAYSSSERRSLLDGSLYDPLLILQPDGLQIGYAYDLADKGIYESGWLTVEYTLDQAPQEILERCYQ